jgi:hypothetical protein
MPSIPLSLLALVKAVAGDTNQPRTIALIITADELPLRGLEKLGDVSGDDLVELCGIYADGSDRDDALDLELMVLATWRPGRGAAPTDDDVATWGAMLDTLADSSVRLLDWLLVDGPSACSMARGCQWQAR